MLICKCGLRKAISCVIISSSLNAKLTGNSVLEMACIAYLLTSQKKETEHSVFLGGAGQGQVRWQKSLSNGVCGGKYGVSGVWRWGKDENVWCALDIKRA